MKKLLLILFLLPLFAGAQTNQQPASDVKPISFVFGRDTSGTIVKAPVNPTIRLHKDATKKYYFTIHARNGALLATSPNQSTLLECENMAKLFIYLMQSQNIHEIVNDSK